MTGSEAVASAEADEAVENLLSARVLEVNFELVALDCGDRAVAEFAVEHALTDAGVVASLIAEAYRRCPRLEDSCGVCDSLGVPWRLVSSREELDVPRKDTGRYLAAGATSVLWLLVQPAHLRDGILAALDRVPDGVVLVAEGNSFHDATIPDLGVMAVTEDGPWKPSAAPLVDRVHVVTGRPSALAALDVSRLWPSGRPELVEADRVAALVLARISGANAGAAHRQER